MKLRVLHVITRLILGGAQENTIATVKGLSARWGFDVLLVAGPPLGPEGSLVEDAVRSGVRLHIVREMRREIQPWLDIVTLVKLYVLMARGRYHVVHTHSSKAGILGRIAARLAGVPVVVHTIHGLPFHPYQNRLFNFLYVNCERFAGFLSDRIITVCDAMARKAITARVAPARKFQTIRSGMELEDFLGIKGPSAEVRMRLGIDQNALVVGKVARLFPLKGHEFLLAAAPRVVEALPQVKFLLVGDGILREKLQEEAVRLGVGKNFIFAGLVRREEIPALLSVMDVVVHTSLREGLARVLPQALAAGKPVVTFDIDGASEVVYDEDTGILVPAGDSAALAEAIVRVLKDPAARRRMGEAGRKMVDPSYRETVMVDSIAALYRTAMAGKRIAFGGGRYRDKSL